MEFAYTVTTSTGRVQRGVTEAASAREVVGTLKHQGFLVLDIRPYRQRFFLRGARVAITARASLVQRAFLARHLALMLRAGLTVDRALQILADQTLARGLRYALREVLADVRRGDALSVACARFPRVFSPLFIAVLRWGEAGGELPESLDRLALQLEKDVQIRGAVRGALVYPAIVLGATALVSILLATFVLPRLLRVFESLRVDLPLPTRIFLFVGTLVAERGIALFAAAVLLVVLVLLLTRMPSAKPFLHRVLLSLPVIGRLVRAVNLARIERVLGSLLRSGLPVVDALATTRDTTGNVLYRGALQAIIEQAQRGESISAALAKFPRLFPPVVNQMSRVGEETGRLREVLLYLADFTEAEIERTTKMLATTLEPILLVVVGLLVGGVAVAIITPIYTLTGSLSR